MRVGPLVLQRLDESLNLPVPARRVARRRDVSRPDAPEDLAEPIGLRVDEGVIGHDSLRHSAPNLGEPAQRALERLSVGVGRLAGMQLDVGQPRVVVDHAMQEVVSDSAIEVLRGPVAGHAVTGLAKAPDLLDVHVQQRSRSRPLIATIGLSPGLGTAREAMTVQNLPDRRARPLHYAREPAWPEVGLASSAEDRLLFGERQTPRLAMRPARAIQQRRA